MCSHRLLKCSAVQAQIGASGCPDPSTRQSPVGGIPAQAPDTGSALDVAQSWLQTAESAVISTMGAVLEFGRNLLGVVTLFEDFADAYNSCS